MNLLGLSCRCVTVVSLIGLPGVQFASHENVQATASDLHREWSKAGRNPPRNDHRHPDHPMPQWFILSSSCRHPKPIGCQMPLCPILAPAHSRENQIAPMRKVCGKSADCQQQCLQLWLVLWDGHEALWRPRASESWSTLMFVFLLETCCRESGGHLAWSFVHVPRSRPCLARRMVKAVLFSPMARPGSRDVALKPRWPVGCHDRNASWLDGWLDYNPHGSWFSLPVCFFSPQVVNLNQHLLSWCGTVTTTPRLLQSYPIPADPLSL